MGEQDHALHEIADARARMSKLADELARHAQPDRVKEIAKEKATEWKERAKELATEKAGEMKEQAKEAAAEKVAEMKTRAKEAVMHTTMDMKERADTPRGWSLLGAILGAGVGAVLMKKAFSVREERYGSHLSGGADFRYRGEHYPTSQRTDIGGAGISGDVSAMGSGTGTWANTSSATEAHGGVGLKDRASDVAHTVKDKAYDLKDRAQGVVGQVRDRASHLRERIPSGGEMKVRTTDWFDRAVENQPLMLALGSVALGIFASMFIPVTSRERQLIEPAKRKAQESISQLGDQLGQKLQGQEQSQGSNVNWGSDLGVGSNIGGMHAREEVGYSNNPSTTSTVSGTGTMSTMGSSVGSEDLMGADRPEFGGTDGTGALSTSPGSRIPPLPPLDDLSTKIH